MIVATQFTGAQLLRAAQRFDLLAEACGGLEVKHETSFRIYFN